MWVAASWTEDLGCTEVVARVADILNVVDRDRVRAHAAFAIRHGADPALESEDKMFVYTIRLIYIIHR